MITNEAIALIKKWEGCSLKSYKCPSGIWTVGYGHTSDDYFPVLKQIEVSKSLAEELLLHDISDAEALVKSQVKVELNPNQYGALVSIAFNSGSFKFKKNGKLADSLLLQSINKKDFLQAHFLIQEYKITGGGKVLKGLIDRRQAEAYLFIKPCTAELLNLGYKPVMEIPE